MGLTNVMKMLALSGPPLARSPQRPTMSSPLDVVVLKHCRCMDCRNFSHVGADYFCSEYIGGTSVVWATGKRFCDPPPDAWHYCACYHGPQISKDVWLWPRRSRQVGAGSKITAKPAAPTAVVDDRDVGEPIVNGSFLGSYADDRDGNSRAPAFSLYGRQTHR